MKYLLMLFLLIGCAQYSVKETTICEKSKPAFQCKKHGFGVDIIAVCETLDECNKICADARK